MIPDDPNQIIVNLKYEKYQLSSLKIYFIPQQMFEAVKWWEDDLNCFGFLTMLKCVGKIIDNILESPVFVDVDVNQAGYLIGRAVLEADVKYK